MQIPADMAQILAILAPIIGSSGAAWVGVKVSLNGTRERVREIHAEVKEIREHQIDQESRVAVLEDRYHRPGKVDRSVA